MTNRKFIVLGLHSQGLAILKELGKAGADVTACCKSKKEIGYHSKYGKRILYNTIEELKSGIASLLKASEEKPVCYITSGETLAMVLSNYKELYDICEVSSGPLPVIEMLAHKDKMYAYAAQRQMPIANYVTLDKYEDGQLTFPAFLKRNYEIPLFFKAVKINNKEELDSYISRIPPEHLCDVILQEFISIPQDELLYLSCQGFYVEGECCGVYLGRQKRRLKKGITSYMEEVTDSQIVEMVTTQSNAFMRDLRYNGFAEFEFMLNSSTEELYFIEVNTRVCGTQSGFHFKFSNLHELLINPREKRVLLPRTPRLRWMNIVRDIRARVESRDFRNLTDFFHSNYDIFDIHDIKPFIFQFLK